MSYCTQQDLIDRGFSWEINERTGGNAAMLARAIADADAAVDAELSNFPRPIAPVTPRLTKIACDITRYFLYADREVPEQVRALYDQALAFLRRVNDGKADLGVDTAGEPQDAQLIVMSSSQSRLFGRKT